MPLDHAMDPADRRDELSTRRSRARRTALVVAVIAVLIYVGFIAFSSVLLK